MKKTLEWKGPFRYRDGKLLQHTIDPAGPLGNEVDAVSKKRGVYCIVGDHPIYGGRSLLYIGRTKETFLQRLRDQSDWLNEEWRVEIYFAELEPPDLQEAIEKFLIYAHSPAYNSQHIDTLRLKEPLTIWNTGRYWRLLPEISSEHPWYKQAEKRIEATQSK